MQAFMVRQCMEFGGIREGASSIVMSGGYEDDIDELDYILYTRHDIQRRNKKDHYTIKNVWVYIRKLMKREQRKHYTQFKVGDWEVWREYYFFCLL